MDAVYTHNTQCMEWTLHLVRELYRWHSSPLPFHSLLSPLPSPCPLSLLHLPQSGWMDGWMDGWLAPLPPSLPPYLSAGLSRLRLLHPAVRIYLYIPTSRTIDSGGWMQSICTRSACSGPLSLSLSLSRSMTLTMVAGIDTERETLMTEHIIFTYYSVNHFMSFSVIFSIHILCL